MCHDTGHPGLNNPFLVDTSHELALRYNDKSPLENMHASRMFGIAREGSDGEQSAASDRNIFANFSTEQYKDIRQLAVDAILHTDMVKHFPMIKDLQRLVVQLSEKQ